MPASFESERLALLADQQRLAQDRARLEADRIIQQEMIQLELTKSMTTQQLEY